ncbi:MAG: hypothetical protein GWN67_00115 [Phycisphaerae bacterium]|nr:hypothetical protein [Phycisphaerae bacterium]NIP50405.1 hypothetical protein [Phycisphaerae bacterium]NIS49521.1 hypothetical protein [Phycisphaerae bacterium]NIU07291.1 hypothetical protein [Phycisphaerae bacterium]NIU54851.1 hypothetical protein [Phycisphaerae bacterium]
MLNRVLLIMIVLIYVGGCEGETRDVNSAEDILEQDENGNLVLYVSNQSFAISPVDITIHIDGKKAVDRKFDVGNQHNWIGHSFSLSKGEHKLVAVSKKGRASFEGQFEIKDKHWAVIVYSYYPDNTRGAEPTPKQFNFNIQDKPIYFQ